ncbi:MAG: antifreeze protein [Celeribacter sp.]|jgi:hypothetical protein
MMLPYNVTLNTWRAGVSAMLLATEAQTVMAYRMMGLAGLWSVDAKENSRMMSEKPPAFAASAIAASTAMMRGQRPDQVMTAAMVPLKRKTSSNVKRLSRRGPKAFV